MSELKTADAPKTAVPLVNLTIDGRPVSVPKGTNVVLAAKKLGIHIPHYCYHEKLSVAGNCRMCLIEMGTPKVGPDKQPVLKPDGTPEISWIPRAQIGCATTVSEGMAIKTASPMVEDCRKGVMEFLLINHPLDCPICDQAGECQLQEYSVEYGNGESRFVEEKVHKPKQVELGPRVMLDDERCILCSRCIRFSKEIAKDDVLGFTERGSHSTLTCYPGKKLENNYSLNTVDICPVGALTSTDFRFKMRVWFLKETDSICTSCSTGCNTQVSSREGVVYRYTPRRNDAVNSDWMCDYGRLNYKWINSEKRLLEPRINTNDHPPLSGDWNVALTEARRKLQSSPGKFAILASGRCSNEELYLARQLAEHYRAVTTDIMPRHGPADDILLSADRNPNTAGAQLFGLTGSEPGSNLQKIKEGISNGQIRTLLVLDECAVKAGIPIEILGKLENLIVIDILPSETSNRAHILLPGTAHVEKRGTMVNKQKRIQRFQQAFLPKGAARPHWEILNLLRPETHVSTFEGLFKEMCSQMPGLQGLDWNAVGDQGVPLQTEGAVNRS
jgi:NADH-quinone oxidoreductase subunit G